MHSRKKIDLFLHFSSDYLWNPFIMPYKLNEGNEICKYKGLPFGITFETVVAF